MLLCENIRDALVILPNEYYKLILVLTQLDDKAEVVEKISNKYAYDVFNVNLRLSEKLISVPIAERWIYVDEYFKKLLNDYKTDVIVLNNIEILFEPHLKIDPLRLLKSASRYRKIIAIWTGNYTDEILTYAEPSHPEYRRYKNDDLDFIMIRSNCI
ncbi:BREX-3 system P-loop-containing protein BrxF [Thermoanaerobacterium thermosaccharolyticum]|uniref:BREX-3 system P-loop-containing protein BrxF n=1 Tax=Thermoanaerobacterium thermosaccharolyticum TaxID=1517 RepID=UPI00123BC256|nr:BREX-3 system P-loop-containing protein BrxF [Thermoanaerobacterium thermosaccharolyticum]KAA5807904.1 BREX-3 system P-loop-containing protein BrxF [Thermoanaerobacterium thermosaccharolyticum]